ncbi:hypothetical protein [Methylobacterium sp. WL9]|uniref:DUF6894 family protein n=1 Tax=Methylobacterium sp. WL9 TaxID=2603898 RepID=UPI0011C7081F|nr:hypothetical protein [Methylobacterium sp. WL9]TXN24000.1 hypothetical protein FV217_04860 [Methylobacterium sp. WL9]
MPRFHFNVYDGKANIDSDGTDFDTWEDARVGAICSIGYELMDDAKRIALGEEWRMEVTDDAGLVLLRLDFSMIALAP